MSEWWKRSVIYALFPYSFRDSNGDGFGDIAGIAERLDYLAWLGVDAVWLGPLYRSPMVDAGYDISDFCDIDPLFGSLESFDALVSAIHERGMRLLLDLVPNHTSDRHPWFLKSRSSLTNPKRDWYIWRPGQPGGKPPSNWIDNTKQRAWAWDEATGQYYYHLFLPSQPDLNFRNPEVVAAIEDVMRFWLGRGVDGFRLDAAMSLVEDDQLRDEPLEEDIPKGPPGWLDHLFTSDRPETADLIARFRQTVDAYPDRLLIGEVIAPVTRAVRFYGSEHKPGFHFPMNNQLMKTEPWVARRIDAAIDQFMVQLPEGAWPNWVLGSHDVTRTASRLGQAQARVAAMLLMTLPGAVLLYYGDELGLEDIELGPDEVRDPYEPYGTGRDTYRAPMPWSAEEGAGFTTGKPWLPLPKDFATRNVEALKADPCSILMLHRALIELRHAEPALQTADYQPLKGGDELVAFVRPDAERPLLIAVNFGEGEPELAIAGGGEVVLSTAMDRSGPTERVLKLRPNEGVVVLLGR